jgi:hypothetical protein
MRRSGSLALVDGRERLVVADAVRATAIRADGPGIPFAESLEHEPTPGAAWGARAAGTEGLK